MADTPIVRLLSHLCEECGAPMVRRVKTCPFEDICEESAAAADCPHGCEHGKIIVHGCVNERCENYINIPGRGWNIHK